MTRLSIVESTVVEDPNGEYVRFVDVISLLTTKYNTMSRMIESLKANVDQEIEKIEQENVSM